MSRAVLILLLAVLLACAPQPAPAQTPAAAPGDITQVAVDYTKTVMVGIVGGGVVLHMLVGGSAATLVGALAGSTLASWVFINHEARHYVIQRAGARQSGKTH